MKKTTVKNTILEYLAKNKGRKYKMEDLQYMFFQLKPETVGRTLRLLAQRKKIKRDDNGYYWYMLEDKSSSSLLNFCEV